MTSLSAKSADDTMLAARFNTAPCPASPGDARRRLDEWLGGLADEHARAVNDIMARFPKARAVLEGIAEFSPYLFDLMYVDEARTARLLACEPSSHLETVIAAARDVVAEAGDEATVMTALRRMKAEAALLIALCDIGGVWRVSKVTAALTAIADAAAQCAIRYLLAQETARGRLTPADPARPRTAAGSWCSPWARWARAN